MSKKPLIVVVGVGALGSHLVQFIRNLDANIRIIDFDRIEQKNTMSQFHPKPHTGKAKAQALKMTMTFLWKKDLDVVSNKLTKDNVEELLEDSDLIIDCLDNAPSRKLVQDWAKEHPLERKGGPCCLHGALDADGNFGQVIWTEDFKIDSGSPEGTATCEDGEHLPFIVTVAAYLARAAQLFIADGTKVGFQVHPGGATKV